MLRVEVRCAGLSTVVLGSQETLVFGRAPHAILPEEEPDTTLQVTTLSLPHSTPHTSRMLGELIVGDDIVRLRWHGGIEAQLASLFEAPGGARRVTLVKGMTALLDEGENTVTVLRGRQGLMPDQFDDLTLEVTVRPMQAEPAYVPVPAAEEPSDGDEDLTAPAPTLKPGCKEWFVALALAEPWLVGHDSYPRPPSNREIYERVLAWHGYAWNLVRPQRVDDAIRVISRIAFGPRDDPFAEMSGRRVQNVRFAIGRRAAEVRLVTAEDLADAYSGAHELR
ncbi:hypothetical protein [Granulicoccus sp. GXG6511]|uniref:hypothetical protein n=1 Tax=Granulicoccus sp. GXG6511 TaxID=3381351 RepID=UPI003D7C6C4C